jgi:hypothetical protein
MVGSLDPYIDMSATVVTAFYPLSRSKHGVGKYMAWIDNFCKIPCNLVVFTDSTTAPVIRERRGDLPIHIVVKEFNTYRITSPPMMRFWTRQHATDPEQRIHNPELYAIWAMKQECVRLSVEANPFSSQWFIWCDIGIQRDPTKQSLYMNFPGKVGELCEPGRISFLEVGAIPDAYVADWASRRVPMRWPAPSVTLGGGCIAGDAAAWEEFGDKYLKMLDKFKDRGWFAGKDQIVYFAMLMERITEKPFRLFYASSHAGLDNWMSFPVILGGDAPPVIDARFES